MTEASVQARVRLAAARAGDALWRNNVGAGYLSGGAFVRFGLANDSAAVNANLKSADLIGIRPVLVTPEHVGTIIGRFVSRECKTAGWRFHPNDEREAAQQRWADLVNRLGGDAAFSTGDYP